MSASNVIAAPMNPSRAAKKGRFSSWSLVLLGLCIWVLCPSFADCAPASRTTASSPLDQRELIALNLLGIRYAKGRGVKRNPGLAMRFFLRSATQGYTPAMANLGTLYEIGAMGHSDFQRAYAWVRAALSFGVPEEDHDETVLKLWMIAARLGPDRIEEAERLADVISTRIVESCNCSPGQEPELAYIDFP
jgi:TPR repeat protein